MTPEELTAAFGAWLRSLRGAHNLSAEGLAHRSGVAVERIRAIERARQQPPSLDEAAALLTAVDPTLLPRLIDLAMAWAAVGSGGDQESVVASVSRMATSLGVVGSSPVATAFAELADSLARGRGRVTLLS